MTHIVTSSTPKTLKSGRMVFPGGEVSDKEAEENSRLVEQGALTLDAESAAAERKAAEDKAAAEAEAARKQAEAEKAAAERKTAPRSSGRSKAPAPSSVPTKEDQK